MVGKERVRISDQQYRSKVSGISPSPCCEFLSLAFPADELQAALAKDKDLDVKIGVSKPFTIGAQTRDKMRRFVKAVRSGAY
jgi:hypothetical protein